MKSVCTILAWILTAGILCIGCSTSAMVAPKGEARVRVSSGATESDTARGGTSLVFQNPNRTMDSTITRVVPLPHEPTITLLVKGGISFYGDLHMNILEESGADERWKGGSIVGVGVELQLTRAVAIQEVVEFSHHTYNESADFNTMPHKLLNDPTNTILDISTNCRFLIGNFYLLGGVAFSREHQAEISWSNSFGSTYHSPAIDESLLSGTIGMGLQFQASDVIGILLEGSLRIRGYTTPVLETGLNYRF